MSAELDYISYLETKVCDQAWRVGQLEAALLYVLTMKERKESADDVYFKASMELWQGMTLGLEMKENFKRLTK
jgi:hypothetical protein